MSTVAAPPPDTPILSGHATRERRAFPRPPGETVFGVLLAIGLAAIGLRAGGGLLLAPTAKVEIWLDARQIHLFDPETGDNLTADIERLGDSAHGASSGPA